MNKNSLALLELMIKEIEEIHKLISINDFIDFLCANNFLSWCSRLERGTNICNVFHPLRVQCSLVLLNNPDTCRCRFVWICVGRRNCLKALHQNLHEKVLKSWTEALLNRSESTTLLYKCTLKFLIISCMVEGFCTYKVFTELLLPSM